ncbi:MAG: V4R domain-containing protein [Phototrophicaceae bacterium]
MLTAHHAPYWPYRLVHALLVAAESALGGGGMLALMSSHAVFQPYVLHLPAEDFVLEVPFEALAALDAMLDDVYGERGGRALALRIGARAFEVGWHKLGVLQSIGTPEFQALPLTLRARGGLAGLAQVFNTYSSQNTELQDTPTAWQLRVAPSPFAYARYTEHPTCHLQIGIIQGLLRWAASSAEFIVHETQCQALGAEACVFAITKKPIVEVKQG